MRSHRLFLILVAGIGAPLMLAADVHAGSVHHFCVSSIRAQFDSDQRQDTAVVYSTRSNCDAMDGRSWYLVVRLAGGRVLRRPLGHDRPVFSSEFDVGCVSFCEVGAAPDFNRDGRHEIEVALQEGASEEQRGIYGVVGGKLRRLAGRQGGKRFSLTYGGSVTHGAYVVCRTRDARHLVLAVGWGIIDNAHAALREEIYRFHRRRFRLVGIKSQRTSTRVIPPRVAGYLC
jgi:hypothetical protein